MFKQTNNLGPCTARGLCSSVLTQMPLNAVSECRFCGEPISLWVYHALAVRCTAVCSGIQPAAFSHPAPKPTTSAKF